MKKDKKLLEVVNDALNNINNNTDSLVKLMNFTPIYFVGANTKLPMFMRQSHLIENIIDDSYAKRLGLNLTKKHYHGLGVVTFIKVIKSLNHPLKVYRYTNKGIYKSDNYIALTNIIDNKNNNNIMVPVRINQRGQYNSLKVKYNAIKTMYGKDNFNYFENMINEGYLFEIYSPDSRYSLTTNLKIFNTYIENYNDVFGAEENYCSAINILMQEEQNKNPYIKPLKWVWI